MKVGYKLAIVLAAGVAIGGAIVQGLHAQGTPAYVIVDISDITDPAAFKAVPIKASPTSLSEFGGKYIVRSENIVAVDGPTPKRFVIIEFDSLEHAKAWRVSENNKEIDAIRLKATKSREFIVVGGM